jgi:hypothetical protein
MGITEGSAADTSQWQHLPSDRQSRECNEVSEGALSGSIVVWIDALRINQKDTEERTQQVQLMGDIYKKCQEVIVYLDISLRLVCNIGMSPCLSNLEDRKHLLLKFRKRFVELHGVDMNVREELIKEQYRMIETLIMAATLSRRLIVCSDYVGLGSAATRVGGEVHLLMGGRTPFVLRPVE